MSGNMGKEGSRAVMTKDAKGGEISGRKGI